MRNPVYDDRHRVDSAILHSSVRAWMQSYNWLNDFRWDRRMGLSNVNRESDAVKNEPHRRKRCISSYSVQSTGYQGPRQEEQGCFWVNVRLA